MPWGFVQARIKEPCDKDRETYRSRHFRKPPWSLADYETNLAKTLVAIHSKECLLYRISIEKWQKKKSSTITNSNNIEPWEKEMDTNVVKLC